VWCVRTEKSDAWGDGHRDNGAGDLLIETSALAVSGHNVVSMQGIALSFGGPSGLQGPLPTTANLAFCAYPCPTQVAVGGGPYDPSHVAINATDAVRVAPSVVVLACLRGPDWLCWHCARCATPRHLNSRVYRSVQIMLRTYRSVHYGGFRVGELCLPLS